MVDWLARTAMLILSALATLALIGSLASVSNSPIGDAFPGTIAEPGAPTASESGAQAASDPRTVEPDARVGSSTMTIEAPTASPPPAEHEIARWLKALTYAVLALAVFGAAGVIALARIATHLRRIAER